MLIKIKLKEKQVKISSPEKVSQICRQILNMEDEIDRDKEHVWVIGLKTSNVIKYIELVALGHLNGGETTPREIFRRAILNGVNSIILIHNHPGGGNQPSEQDKIFTTNIQKAGRILNIKLLDHVIITENDFYSFQSNNIVIN